MLSSSPLHFTSLHFTCSSDQLTTKSLSLLSPPPLLLLVLLVVAVVHHRNSFSPCPPKKCAYCYISTSMKPKSNGGLSLPLNHRLVTVYEGPSTLVTVFYQRVVVVCEEKSRRRPLTTTPLLTTTTTTTTLLQEQREEEEEEGLRRQTALLHSGLAGLRKENVCSSLLQDHVGQVLLG